MKLNVNPKLLNVAMCCAMTAMLVTAFLPIVLNENLVALRVIFAVAAAVTLLCQVLMPGSEGAGFRIRRLARMNVWAAVLYCVAATCLFIHDETMQRSWVAFLLAGAVLQIYATLMIGHLSNKR